VTASPTTVQTLNEADYQRYRVPEELASFGSLQTASGYLPLQALELTGDITGLCYRLKLRQRFFNTYSEPLEATYIFPMPARAAVSSFVMQTQQRRVVGVLQERGEARRQYQAAISQGKQAALAEEDRAEVFTMTVGNIPPREFVEIDFELNGPLSWADGEAMFRFPLVVAPRYIPGAPYAGEQVGSGTGLDTDAVPDASRISPPVLLPGYPNPVRLAVQINVQSGGLRFGVPRVSVPELACSPTEGGFRLQLQPTANRLDRDLIVRFPLAGAEIQSTFQVESGEAGEHYFSLNLVPGERDQRGPALSRQVVTLLDRSGSMEGWKMVCARRAVGRLVDSLTDQDSFQVLNFDTVIEPLDPRKRTLRTASDRERFLSMEQLGKVEARGGTEILQAIQCGVDLLQGEKQPYLVLITDGQVGNESEVLRWIQQNAKGIRFFTVGIDSAVNVALLERIAQVTGGHFTLVESEEQLDQSMTALRQRINPPLLANVQIQLSGAECAPRSVDLYPGSCSRLLGRCQGALPETVQVRGFGTDGTSWSREIPLQRTTGNSLQKVWARERVLELEHGFLAGWRDYTYQPASITQFALAHGVLCRFTAFVAIDDQSYVPGQSRQVTQAVSQPAGWRETQAPQSHIALDPFSGADPFASAAPSVSSFPGMASPTAAAADPFAGAGGGADPFCAPAPEYCSPADPFASSADPFVSSADPFGAPAADAFAPLPDLFANAPAWQPPAEDPFAPPARAARRSLSASAPAAKPAPPKQHSDPLDDLLQKLASASTASELLVLLGELKTLLGGLGYFANQLEPLDKHIDFLKTGTLGDDRAQLLKLCSEIQKFVASLTGKPAGRGSFWT
jgi:Ca-activated chloride channel homolog